MNRNILIALTCLLAAPITSHAGLIFDFDYRYDSYGFFDDPDRREALEAAGRLVNWYVDDLDSIIPEGDNGWSSFFTLPDGTQTIILSDLPIPADTMQIFVAGRPLPGRLAQAEDTGPLGIGTEEWANRVRYRGELGAMDDPATDFGPMGGRLSFNNDPEEVPWHFDLSTDDLDSDEFDFITVAMHEIIHLLGIGISVSFNDHVDSQNRFVGPQAVAVGSPTNPNLELDEFEAHFISDTKSPWNGELQEALLAPGIYPGERAFPTRLDRAVLRDIGWEEAIPGDANRDREFNSTDLLTVFQVGNYELGIVSGWSDGDWNDNALFESGDLVEALQTGTYEQGPQAAIFTAAAPSEGEIVLEYDPQTGDIVVDSENQILTSFQLTSEENIFTTGHGESLNGIFDVDRADKIFKLNVDGFSELRLESLAPAGLSEDFLLTDLSIDGSLLGGGGLENVRLSMVPEPSGLLILLAGLVLLRPLFGRSRRRLDH